VLDALFFNEYFLSIKGSSKNVIPAQAGIQNYSKLLDSRLRGSDKLGIIRGSLKFLSNTSL